MEPIIVGIAAVIIVTGIILAIKWKESRRRKKFWIDPPFET